MLKREPIQLTDSTFDAIRKLSEGNPGAANIVIDLLKDETHGLFDLLHLDDMNIRGVQIWLGYKNYSGGDIEKFRAALRSRDPKMVEAINSETAYDPAYPKAVTHGASYEEAR